MDGFLFRKKFLPAEIPLILTKIIVIIYLEAVYSQRYP